MDPVIILGTGLAAYTLAKEFRKLNTTTPILMISKDAGHFYSKPLLSTALYYNRDIPDLYTADAPTMAKQLNADILTHTPVIQIHPKQRQVVTEKQTLSYSQLVLALGADAIKAPITGNAVEHILSVNDLEDYALFRQSLHTISKPEKKRIAILGAGLVGCEFANDLAHSGHHVEMIDYATYPVERLLPEPIGKALQQALSAAGVAWHFSQEIKHLEKRGSTYHLTLSKDQLEADLVLSAIGLKPRVSLAIDAGLETARGIIVNAQLKTSDPHIYALGDCAEVNGLVLLFIAPIRQCSQALSKTLNGEPTSIQYPAMPISLKTPACPIVVCPPKQNTSGEWRVEGKYPNLKALFIDKKGNIQGFALSGLAVKGRLDLTKALPPLFE